MTGSGTGIKIRHSLYLLLAAVIWGFAFAFQRLGGDSMGPFTFNMLRSFIGAAALIPVILFRDGSLKPNRTTLKGGILCGLSLGAACNLQQLGLMYTSPGKAGFITGTYMIIVAVASLFTEKKPCFRVLLSVLLGAAGLWLICLPAGAAFSVGKGEGLCILCAFFYAVQIFLIYRYSEGSEPLKMTAVEFLTAGVISLLLTLAFEEPTLQAVKDGLIPLLYVGVFSTGAAYALQMTGIAGLDPAVSSLIMSLESVFSVVGEFLILGTVLTGRALTGCVLMFAAIVLSQADLFRKKGAEYG